MMQNGLDSEKKRIQVLTLLFGCYGQSKDTDRLNVYSRLLADIPIPLLGKACQKLMLSEKFLPAVSEIIACSKALAQNSRNIKQLAAEEAWAEVQEQMRKCSYTQKPEWSSIALQKTVATIGWANLLNSKVSELGTLRAQFRDIYNAIQKRGYDDAMNGYIMSSTPEEKQEAVNGLLGVGVVMASLYCGMKGDLIGQDKTRL